MKQMRIFLILLLALTLPGCGALPAAHGMATQPAAEAELEKISDTTDTKEMTEGTAMNRIKLTIGSNSVLARLEKNDSTKELINLLKNGSITMDASNYGGFEKVCALGTRITSKDVQTTTCAGDIMLYCGNQIVIFYGSNRWAYTRLGKVVEEDIPNLREILSGSESEVILELAD